MTIRRNIRRLALASAATAMFVMAGAIAQDAAFDWNPRSGDAWVDRQLDDVNRYGARYQQPFVDEMVRYYGAPRELVTELLATRRWAAGDVYYACAIAQSLGRPCREIVDEWERDHGTGWGAVAGSMGIKPGSTQFQHIKRGFATTYDRWARPIVLDVEPGGARQRANPDADDQDSSPEKAPAKASDKAHGQDGGQGRGVSSDRSAAPGRGTHREKGSKD